MPRIDDGYQTLISVGGASFWEKGVTPPGISAGGATDTTTMHNTEWRTMAPKKLKTMDECSLTAAYEPEVYTAIVAQIGRNQLITITFPDGSQLEFWGWIDSFTPGEHVEGEQPTADVTIICSNQTDTGEEVAPEVLPI